MEAGPSSRPGALLLLRALPVSGSTPSRPPALTWESPGRACLPGSKQAGPSTVSCPADVAGASGAGWHLAVAWACPQLSPVGTLEEVPGLSLAPPQPYLP